MVDSVNQAPEQLRICCQSFGVRAEGQALAYVWGGGPLRGPDQYCSARNLREIPNLFLFIDLHKGIGERHMAKSLHNRKP